MVPKLFNGSFKDRDVISVEQFTSPKEINLLFTLADEMKKRVEENIQGSELKNKTVAILFYQPSTRTFTSFQAAAKWLGCQRVIAIAGMQAYSSAVKGESLPDTIRTIEATTAANLIVLRHPEDNSSAEAASCAQVPIINAGSGKKEHPTQAILDLKTIQQEVGRLKGLHVAMLGDLVNGRTIKSLAKLLAVVAPSTKITFIASPGLEAPRNLVAGLKSKGLKIKETNDLKHVLSSVDVLYVTRIQKEWFGSAKEYLKAKGSYRITPKLMRQAKKDMIVMHPLPRIDEIDKRFDKDPRAAYFRQMRNGLYTRMALLKAVLGK